MHSIDVEAADGVVPTDADAGKHEKASEGSTSEQQVSKANATYKKKGVRRISASTSLMSGMTSCLAGCISCSSSSSHSMCSSISLVLVLVVMLVVVCVVALT